jgi:hypothetical protein
MPIYTFEHQNPTITKLDAANFSLLGISERAHLQAALKNHIQAISPDTLVISEEFCEWDDSKRRIDLLGIDRDGNIVVIELKRDETGAHMELQALRYAAMVSTMTFLQAVDIYQRYLDRSEDAKNAEGELRNFLNWQEEGKEAVFPNDVRIVLAAANFSKELTTAVMWLNQRDLDIRCVRMKPYKLDQTVLLDIEQIIPLQEAGDYQVRVKQQALIQKTAKTAFESGKRTKYKFDNNIYGAGRLVLAVIRKICADKPNCNLEDLQKIFPKQILSSFEVITTRVEAENILERSGHRRHFLNPTDIIVLADNQKLSVCTQWSQYATNSFIQYIPKDLGYTVDIISHDENLN